MLLKQIYLSFCHSLLYFLKLLFKKKNLPVWDKLVKFLICSFIGWRHAPVRRTSNGLWRINLSGRRMRLNRSSGAHCVTMLIHHCAATPSFRWTIKMSSLLRLKSPFIPMKSRLCCLANESWSCEGPSSVNQLNFNRAKWRQLWRFWSQKYTECDVIVYRNRAKQGVNIF